MSTLSSAPSMSSGPGQLGTELSTISKLTNLNDINRLLHETLAKERAIDAELDKLLSKRLELERNILLLNSSTSEVLELVRADSEQLLSSVHGTAELADKISSKVRRLDLAQSHVTDTLSKISLIMDRSNCITGVQQAMDGGDYEAAAGYISTFMDLEGKLTPLTAAAAVADTVQLEEQRQVLLAAKVQLERVVEARFDEAVAKRDSEGVLRYARLFPPLGRKGDGLTRLVDYLRLAASAKAGQLYTALAEKLENSSSSNNSNKKAATVDFVSALISVLRVFTEAVGEHETLVREAFGPEGMLEVVAGMQSECDNQGSRLVQRFMDVRSIQRLVREITNRKRPAQGGVGAAEPVADPVYVEKLLQEMLEVVQCAEQYSRYMLGRMRDAVSPNPLSQMRENSFRSAPFSVAVRDVVGCYMALEEYYMTESAAIAIRSDEIVGSDAATSTMVDDVLCIMRNCGMRALASANMQCAAALLAELNNLLANTFRAALQGKLQGGLSKLLAMAPAVDGSAPAAVPQTSSTEHAVALNNADVSADYVMKLKSGLEAQATQVFASASDIDRVRNVLSDLGRTSVDFRQLSTRGLEQLGDALMPRLRTVMDEVASVSYTLSESEYSLSEGGESWVSRLLVALEAVITWLRPLLTSNNYESLLGMVLDKVVSRLEVLLAKKMFNQLGGLQLDRDVCKLVHEVSMAEMTSRTVRDKFSRLSQMATLLSMESLEEFMVYWEDHDTHMTCRLTTPEVKAVLSQRMDFSKEAISALQL